MCSEGGENMNNEAKKWGPFLGFIFLLFLCAIPSVSLSAYMGTTAPEKFSNSLWPQKIKVGGEFRLRNENQINYDFNNNSSAQTDVFLLLRTRVYLDLNPADFVQLYAMFQDSETIEQDDALVKTPDRHKFYQGFVNFRGQMGPLKTRLKVGRQELIYGDQRLIGNNGWNNLARSFDAIVWRLENKDFWLDIWGARIHPANNPVSLEYQLASLYGHWNGFPNGELEPYVIFSHSDHGGVSNGPLYLATVGARIKAKFLKNFDYGFEGAYQSGSSNYNLVNAGAVHSRIGYTFPLNWKPRIGGEFDFASGNANPKAGHVTLFNNLFPTNHDKYGYMDFFSWRNIYDFRLAFSAEPFSFMKTLFDYHAFLLPDPANGVFQANGTQLRAGKSGASSFAGQEVDLLLKFEFIKYFDAWVGYSVFFPGSFFSDTGSSDKAHFFYAQLTTRY